MKTLLKAIDGYKTYIGLIGFGILGFAFQLEWVTEDIAKLIATGLTTWTGVALKNSWDKKAAASNSDGK